MAHPMSQQVSFAGAVSVATEPVVGGARRSITLMRRSEETTSEWAEFHTERTEATVVGPDGEEYDPMEFGMIEAEDPGSPLDVRYDDEGDLRIEATGPVSVERNYHDA